MNKEDEFHTVLLPYSLLPPQFLLSNLAHLQFSLLVTQSSLTGYEH